MNIRDTIRRAIQSLLQAKARTLLTSLAIGVGAFALTLTIAAGQGAREYADKLIGSNINPQALFIAKDKTLFEGGATNTGIKEYDPNSATSRTGATIKQLTQEDIDKLKARSDLEAVTPTYQVSFKYFTIQGSERKYTADVSAYDSGIKSDVAAGTLPALGSQIGDGDIVMPESFADGLKQSPQELIGKKITLTLARPAKAPTQAEIAQILATQGTAGLSALADGETKDVTYTISGITKKSSTALTATTALNISSNQAKELSDFVTKDTEAYQKYVAATARAKSGLKPEDVKASLSSAGYSAQTAKDLQNLLFTIVNILQGIVIGFAIVALIASVFGIINTQYISVLERTQQIGLMKALGMRGRDVARLFRYEAAMIGLLGGVIGAGGAWALGTVLNPVITKTLSLGDGNYILVFQILPVAALVVALMLIAVVAGYLPARKAARLDPIEALRTE